MNRLFILLTILLASTQCSADVVQVDSSTWTQEQKNMTAAMSYQLLYKANITYQSVKLNLPTIEVVNPSNPINAVLTKQTIEDEYAAWKVISDTANAAEQQKQTERDAELTSNTIKNISLTQVNNAIDNISNLNDTKVFLKKLVRYLNAKGYLDN